MYFRSVEGTVFQCPRLLEHIWCQEFLGDNGFWPPVHGTLLSRSSSSGRDQERTYWVCCDNHLGEPAQDETDLGSQVRALRSGSVGVITRGAQKHNVLVATWW